MTTRTRIPRPLVAALPVAIVALLLAGCASGSSTDDAASTTTTRSASASDSASTDSTAGGDLATVGAAARKAADGTIISIEREDSGTWEVLLSDAQGAETELHLTADGGVTAGPSAKPDDAEDATENRGFLAAANLDYAQAAAKITAAQAGDIVELNLDDHLGGIVWEADVIDSSSVKHSVRIDAGSGAVVDTSTDTGSDDSDD